MENGTQQTMLDTMQTRNDLYDVLKYRDFERKLDQFMEGNDGK